MVLDDLPDVVAIDRLSFSLPWPSNSYRFELTQNEASHCWVAVLDSDATARRTPSTDTPDKPAPSTQTIGLPGKVVAIVVIWLIEDEAHVATIAVHPDFRGRGLGRHILLAALHDAARRGAAMATLEVRESNRPAINLYQQLGFEIVGRRPRYYQDTHEDALIMTAERISVPEIEKLLHNHKEAHES